MERKIGEIFEYNGEWCQCIVGNDYENCAFNERKCYTVVDNGDPIGDCCADRRKDNKDVIFKKLEKVGEPYTTFVNKTVQNYLLETAVSVPPKDVFTLINNEQRLIAIEIKQNKEDMEEKKQCGDNRFRAIARAKEHLFQATNIAEDKKELEVLDSFLLRCWQMGWLKQYEGAEESKPTLKPFSLKLAKAGKPVCTRDGRKVRVLCYDFKQNEEYPILVAIENKDGKECALLYSNGGISEMYKSSNNELAMLPEKKEGWVNIYKEGVDQYIYNNEKAALSRRGSDCIATIKIEWEE